MLTLIFEKLKLQLPLLAQNVKCNFPLLDWTIPTQFKKGDISSHLHEAMNTQAVYKSMLSEVHNILWLYMTVPITSATSDLSFSALKVVNTYLRSSMSEQRLNNCFH